MAWGNLLGKDCGRLRFFSAAVLGGWVICGASAPAFAHARHYVFNQEYQTLPAGIFELESHTTFEMPHHEVSNENEIEFQEELEYGVTDHLNVSHYETWTRENKAGLDDDGVPKKDVTRYRGFKFETKYRIGERGKYWVDPLLYLEWSTDPQDRENPNSIEGKIVLSKDFDKFNVTYNQIVESKLGKGGRTRHEYTLGVNYEVLPGFRIGGEAEGTYWTPSTNRNEIAMGPTVAYEWKYFWVAVGGLFGVNHAASDAEARIIFGVPFG